MQLLEIPAQETENPMDDVKLHNLQSRTHVTLLLLLVEYLAKDLLLMNLNHNHNHRRPPLVFLMEEFCLSCYFSNLRILNEHIGKLAKLQVII